MTAERTIEFDYGGCLFTDRGSYDEIQAVIGGPGHWMGRPGTIESMRLIEGMVPWPGPPWPRPVYRVRWTPAQPDPRRFEEVSHEQLDQPR